MLHPTFVCKSVRPSLKAAVFRTKVPIEQNKLNRDEAQLLCTPIILPKKLQTIRILQSVESVEHVKTFLQGFHMFYTSSKLFQDHIPLDSYRLYYGAALSNLSSSPRNWCEFKLLPLLVGKAFLFICILFDVASEPLVRGHMQLRSHE